MFEHELLLQNETATPLGRFRLAGRITDGDGVPRVPPLRVYGSYGVMLVLRGSGHYRDTEIHRQPLTAGDVVLVLPERAHWYGTPRGKTWDELYLTFDGPAFDLWRQAGILDAAHPVRHAPDGWRERLETFIADAAAGGSEARRLRQIIAFQSLLAELFLAEADIADHPAAVASGGGADWLTRARSLLDIDLGRPLDLAAVAAEAGMSYETFRKRFQQAVGVSPARYRTQRRIDAARELLRYSPQITNRQAAETLGFADEYHFSRRFTQIAGVSPTAFRRGAEPKSGTLTP